MRQRVQRHKQREGSSGLPVDVVVSSWAHARVALQRLPSRSKGATREGAPSSHLRTSHMHEWHHHALGWGEWRNRPSHGHAFAHHVRPKHARYTHARHTHTRHTHARHAHARHAHTWHKTTMKAPTRTHHLLNRCPCRLAHGAYG
jgi:hypothetical protein